jgi:transposase
MMGERTGVQEALFNGFSLEAQVPPDHMLRAIDRFVDLGDIREQLRPFYSDMGWPSIDPGLMLRMMIVGYAMGIRSDRRLCDAVHLNLAYRWFCRLGLDGAVPDHSTFSKNRHCRFRDSDVLRHLLEAIVAACLAEGLVGGEAFAVDASMVRADANRRNGHDNGGRPPTAGTPAVRECQAALDDAAFGAATPVTPEVISPVAPAARWTSAHGDCPHLAYCTNYLIDLDHAVIVSVEVTNAIRQAEVTAQRWMIERAYERFGLWPERLVADGGYGYGYGADISWLIEERGIEPHIPGIDHSARRDGPFERADVTFDGERDRDICPGAKVLKPKHRHFTTPRSDTDADGFISCRASKLDCAPCALEPQCCPAAPMRKIMRSQYEGARDLARAVATTDADLASHRERKKVEMLFAHLKRILRLDRLRLRGPYGAIDEFHLAAAAQNLRRLAKLLPIPVAPAA